MREPDGRADVHRPMRRLNPIVIVLLGGLVILVLLIAYYASNRNPDQDKLKDTQLSTTQAASSSPEKRCASQATYDLIRRELFRRAAQVRGSDEAAYDNLSHYAVVRMENPVMESQDSATGAVNCSGSLSLDLPPGVAVVGGRRTLMADLDYTVESAADGSGDVVVLRNADAIVTPLATLARIGDPAQSTENTAEANAIAPEQPPTIPAPQVQPPTAPTPAPAQQPASARPSFDCAKARSRGEVAVCSNSGLAALDRNMSAQYSRALADASPEEQALLRRTRDRFLAYRDRCPDNRCVGDAYVGRMREIRDIMEGRWQAPR